MRRATIFIILVLAICAQITSALSSPAEGTPSKLNNSSISFEGQNKIVQAPATISIGRGYYSSHPISYVSGIGIDTSIKNENAVTSMHRDINNAHGVNGEMDVMASDSSYPDSGYNPYDSESGDSATTHMKIDETVTDGKIHFGVLQGSDASGQNVGFGRTDPLIDAWKKPAMEIDEDYIGTYHIYKNMTISTHYSRELMSNSWQNCCGQGYFDMDQQYTSSVNEDRVFNCRSFSPIASYKFVSCPICYI